MAKRASIKTPSKGGAASILSSIGKKGTGKSKSKTPEVNVTDETQLAAIAEVINAKKAMKRADSALKVAEGAFRDDATELFEHRCRTDGALHTSVRFLGTLTPEEGGETIPLSLRFEQKRACCKMQEAEASDPLHSIFKDEFDDFFTHQRMVQIDTSVLTDEQIEKLVEKMQEVLGESFDAAVSVEALVVAKEAFFGQRILNAKVRTKADKAVADGYAVPFSSSFKL